MKIHPPEKYWEAYFTPGLLEKFLQGAELPEIELP